MNLCSTKYSSPISVKRFGALDKLTLKHSVTRLRQKFHQVSSRVSHVEPCNTNISLFSGNTIWTFSYKELSSGVFLFEYFDPFVIRLDTQLICGNVHKEVLRMAVSQRSESGTNRRVRNIFRTLANQAHLTSNFRIAQTPHHDGDHYVKHTSISQLLDLKG